MKTDTQIKIKETIEQMENLIDETHITYADARELINLCYNVQIRYEEIRKSRDEWRKKYYILTKQLNSTET